MTPNTATPTVEPSVRKKFTDAVPAPRSRISTVFCTAIVRTGRAVPMPRPSTSIHNDETSRGESGCMVESSHNPAAATAVPTIG